MLTKTAAIVLRAVRYGDNSIILTVYTREQGLQSLISGGFHSRKGIIKPAMVQVLSMLDIVYYEKGKGSLRRLKEASMHHHFQSLHFDAIKSSLAMFLAEVLQHVLQEGEPDPALFDFMDDSFSQLDEAEEKLTYFHLLFLYRLTHFFGFYPQSPQNEFPYFDLLNGNYTLDRPPHFHFLEKEETGEWKELAIATLKNKDTSINMPKKSRDRLLKTLLEYYRVHIKDFGELQSLNVLRELLN